MIVAIDGPAASGKSTVARALARRLGFAYLDTGAMYRAVAALALDRGIDLADEAALARLAEGEVITFGHPAGDPVPDTVHIGGTDVTAAIRTPEADAAVSAVARVPGVRAAMVAQQRRLAGASDTVVEGRDIGTVVFPDAPVKAYLTASAEERARRRHGELAERGHALEERAVHEGIEARDSADSTRAASPLAVADDAVVVDTTGMSVDEVVERVARLVGEAS
ncbi:MAG: (d)CMP kinase [Anaerosomatales bacterium]|nr:(d)CMP kinase [Anaerosomatales bacterium]